ncbi:hypothetical protein DRN97_02560 [Methanosarcinales archaeon]|nr:MAG: hypothetical protein DRN97_02560 [Methanosarcinales archaeon]
MVGCGVCGIEFETEEDYEKHIFHFQGNRWCGTKILQVIEQNKKLAETVHNARLLESKKREVIRSSEHL